MSDGISQRQLSEYQKTLCQFVQVMYRELPASSHFRISRVKYKAMYGMRSVYGGVSE